MLKICLIFNMLKKCLIASFMLIKSYAYVYSHFHEDSTMSNVVDKASFITTLNLFLLHRVTWRKNFRQYSLQIIQKEAFDEAAEKF